MVSKADCLRLVVMLARRAALTLTVAVTCAISLTPSQNRDNTHRGMIIRSRDFMGVAVSASLGEIGMCKQSGESFVGVLEREGNGPKRLHHPMQLHHLLVLCPILNRIFICERRT